MDSFKRNLIIGYGLSLLLLLGSSIASYISIQRLLESQQLVDHTSLVIRKMENAISILKDAETGQRGYLLSNDEQFLQPYNGAKDRLNEELKSLLDLTADNSEQQSNLHKLTELVEGRMNILQSLIDQKRKGLEYSMEDLRSGKIFMDRCRQLVNEMENKETVLLSNRVKQSNAFAQRTPLFIIVASLLSLLVTIISLIRLNADYNQRKQLQESLQEKDREIDERINIISAIAEKVSSGDYTISVEEGFEDKLGELATSLNKMTASLHHSFSLLTQKEWLQSGISSASEKLLGEQTIYTIAENVMDDIVEFTNSSIAGFYHYLNGKLEFIQGYSFAPPADRKFINAGEGMIGQVLIAKKIISIKEEIDPDITINYAAGNIIPRHILGVPVFFENNLKAVLLLGSLKHYEAVHMEYLDAVAEKQASPSIQPRYAIN